MVKRVSEKLTWKNTYSSELGEGMTVPTEAKTMSWDADMVNMIIFYNLRYFLSIW